MTTLIQPPPPSYRKWWWVPAVLLVVALVVAAVIFLPDHLRGETACDDGAVRDESGECVRLSDGSVSFATEIDDLVERVRKENNEVEKEDAPWVSIVLLTPMTAGNNEDGFVTMAGIRHRLAGAHLAQLAANETSASPNIRLLLANPGSDFAAWESVVEEIQVRRADENIVAVTGISFSLDNALSTIKGLTRPPAPETQPIGVIASTLTIDEPPSKYGFLKVSPPAEEHARAAAEYLADRNERVMIVRDKSEIDHYGPTLAEAFEAQFPEGSQQLEDRSQTYNAEHGHVANAFRTIMHSICDQKPSTVYFAGRGADALEFLIELAQRECRDLPIQVMTADDMPYHQLSESPARKALDANITVRYTGHVHPDAWHENPDGFDLYATDQFSPECAGSNCYSEFSDGGVHDFAAVMEYDAVKTAVEAIRNAAGPHHTPVDPAAVLQAMLQLNSAVAFNGASGRLDFDAAGLPIDKPILILEAQNGAPPLYLESR